MTFLELLPKIVAFLAIAWTIRQVLKMRDSVLGGRVMIPASMAHILLFILFELIVFFGGFSSLHLLWLWPLSIVLGIVLLFFPFALAILMFFMVLLRLTGKTRYEEDEEFYIEGDDIDFDDDDDEYFDGDEPLEIIDVDFIEKGPHAHSKHKSEKRRKKKNRKKRH